MTILVSDFIELTDSCGVQFLDLRNIPNDTHATDVQTGAVNNVGRVEGLGDTQAIIDLLAGAEAAQQATLTPYNTAVALWGTFIQALYRHVGTFNAYLAGRTIQASPDFAALAVAVLGAGAVSPANVLDPVQRTLGTYAVTAADTGTLTAGDTIDTTQYGAAPVEVATTATIGAADITATLTLTAVDGTTSATRAVTIPNGSASGTMIAVGNQIADPAAAPALTTATTGGTLPPGLYTAAYTWTNADGETQRSPTAQVIVPYSTSTPANTITFGALSLPSGATGIAYYLSRADGATLYATGTGTGAAHTVTAPVDTSSATPPAANGLWDAWIACTAVTIVGGTAADAFAIETVAPRTPAR